MLLKDCQKGYPVFILNRNEITVCQGKIVDVSRPHFDNHNPSNTSMVIDVAIDMDGKQSSFVMPENANIAYTDNLIITSDRTDILREVQAICSRNEEELKQTKVREQTVAKCKSILEDWNPELKERRMTDERISKIEGVVSMLKQNYESSDAKMDKILKLLETK